MGLPSLWKQADCLSEYAWPEIRYSISWKAYCFRDGPDRTTWEQGSDDLSLEQVLDTLEQELRTRGVLLGQRPGPDAFAMMMVQTFISFPGRLAPVV